MCIKTLHFDMPNGTPKDTSLKQLDIFNVSMCPRHKLGNMFYKRVLCIFQCCYTANHIPLCLFQHCYTANHIPLCLFQCCYTANHIPVP